MCHLSGKQDDMNAKKLTAKRAYDWSCLVLLAVKTYADVKKHRHSGPHDQTCPCYHMCLPCIVTTAKSREGEKD
jgi:hypothetical protein